MRAATPIRVCYADPPYPGCAHLYSKPGTPEYHPDAMRWDDPAEHVRLIASMDQYYPDGWALSTNPDALSVVGGAPRGSRLAAWCRNGGAGPRIAFCWELLIYKVPTQKRGDCTADWIMAGINTSGGFTGAKPPAFSHWLFKILGVGAHPDDEFVDMFPGSGAVTRAWDEFRAKRVTRGTTTQGNLFDVSP